MKNCLVSVIIPIYNVEKYLERCLDSVLKQTYKNLEIICINDCSIDNSLNILQEYVQKDNRIRIINHEKNKGISATRNTGLDTARGEYIYFVDSDDWIDSDYIENMLIFIKETQTDFVVNLSVYKEFLTETVKQISNIFDENIEKLIINDGSFYINKIPCMVWMYFYKKSFLDKFDSTFPIGYIHEDIYYQYINFLHAKNIGVFYGSFYHYWQNSNGIMSVTKDRDLKYMKIFSLIFDYLNKYNLLEYNVKLFNVFPFFFVDTEEKYNFYKNYFMKVKDVINNNLSLYTKLDIFFMNKILTTDDLSDFINLYGKNVSIAFLKNKGELI